MNQLVFTNQPLPEKQKKTRYIKPAKPSFVFLTVKYSEFHKIIVFKLYIQPKLTNHFVQHMVRDKISLNKCEYIIRKLQL